MEKSSIMWMLPSIALASSQLILLLLTASKRPHCFQALSLRMCWTQHTAPPCNPQWDGFVRMHDPSLSWIPSFLLPSPSSLEWPWLAVPPIKASRAVWTPTTTYPEFHCEEKTENEWKLSNYVASCQNTFAGAGCCSYGVILSTIESVQCYG